MEPSHSLQPSLGHEASGEALDLHGKFGSYETSMAQQALAADWDGAERAWSVTMNPSLDWVGRDPGARLSPLPRQGPLPPDQAAPSPVQAGLEHLQGYNNTIFIKPHSKSCP